jgi:hypothetical protein
VRRRDALKALGLAAGSIALSPRGFALGADDPIRDLSVTIRLGGSELVFPAKAGKDLGDFKASRFVQRCVRVDHEGSPLTVFFRPDRDSDRMEVVVELGRMWGEANNKADHFGAYRAIIHRGAKEIAAIDVPRHWWFSRWRWQSAPRPIIRSPGELISARLMLPYDSSAASFAETPTASESSPTLYRRPMDTAGVVVAVGGTGERHDIGPVTEYQAHFLVTGSKESLAALRAQAEAAASMPMHIRDENTSAPVDFLQYPGLDWYYTGTGEPWVKGNEAIRGPDGKKTGEWTLNAAHDPALNYLPYLLTDDPYHLEELQFQGNQTLGYSSYHRSETGLQLVYPGETRAFAWSMRTMFQLAKVTPEATPAWLLPRAHWRRIVADNLKWFTAHYVDNPSPVCSVFHAGTRIDSIAAWQEDFLALCLGWGVHLGFEEWRKAYRWKLQSSLDRSNGTSGWPPQWCCPYYFYAAKAEPEDMLYSERSPPDIWFKSWAEAWKAYQADEENEVREPFSNKWSWAQPNSPHYLIYLRGVLAFATHLGVEEARGPFEFVDRMAKGERFMLYKWAIAPK